MKKRTYLIIKSTLTGIMVGLFIVVFKYATNYAVKFSNYFFFNSDIKIKILGYFLIVLASFISYKFTKISGNIQGSGLPQLEINLKKDLNNITIKKALPLMFINSLISVFCGIPVAVGGSVAAFLSGLVGQINNNIMNKYGKYDDGNIICAAGAGVSASLGTPIGGMFYGYEECEKELKKTRVLYSLYMSLIAYAISYLIGPGFYDIFRITKKFNNDYIYIILMIITTNIVLSFLVMNLVPEMKKIINKNYKKKVFKYRLFVAYAITLVIMIFIPVVGGPGLNIFNLIALNTSVYLLILYLIIRVLLLLIISNSTISGGQILPEIAIGILVGLIFSTIYNVPVEDRIILCLASSVGFVGAVNKTPLTALFLGLSFAGYKNIEFSILPISITVGLTFLPIYISKIDDVNDALLSLLRTSDQVKGRVTLKRPNKFIKKEKQVHAFQKIN